MENKKAAFSITYFLKNIFFLSQKGIILNEPGHNRQFYQIYISVLNYCATENSKHKKLLFQLSICKNYYFQKEKC